MNIKKIFILKSNRIIAPFEDPVDDVLINQQILKERRMDALAFLKIPVVTIAHKNEISPGDFPCLLIADDIYFNKSTVMEFVKNAEKEDASCQLIVNKNTSYFKLYAQYQSGEEEENIVYKFFYLKNNDEKHIQKLKFDIGEFHFPLNIPLHMTNMEKIVMPGALRPILEINHPIHILWSTIISILVRFVEAFNSPFQKLTLFLRSLSSQPAKILSKMNKIGRGCDIHPTAYLEGSTIGDNVRIGANAVIRLSNIGDYCDIGDCSVVRCSCLGAGSVTFDDLNLNYALTYPETFLIHGPYNLSIFGRQSAVFATIITDYRLDGKPIKLDINGELKPFAFPFIGSFIGHRTRIAGGSIIAPGRLIPNDLLIFPETKQVLAKIDENLPEKTPLQIINNRLVPI